MTTTKPRPEKVAPRRYRPGEKIDVRLYGTIDPQGRITPTANQGRAPVRPGERGVILLQAGRKVPKELAARLNGG